MIDGRRVLAVVPARGGSKGIPLKNLKTVGGVSLVGLAGRVAAALPEIDRRVVSTDHEAIALAAVEAGLDAPFRRPENLSGDRIGDREVLAHALEAMEAVDGCRFDVVLMLQPTSPLRTPDQVRATLRKLVDGNFDAVWTVSETDLKSHPLKQLVIRGGELDYFDTRGASIVARQQLEPVYHRNGVAYAITRDCLLEQESIKGARAGAVVLDGLNISIDTLEDIEKIEKHLGVKV